MCGRARCSLAREAVLTASGVPDQRWRNQAQHRPSYNCSPGAWLPVMKLGADGTRELHTMKWGLVPSFTRLAPGERPDHYRMFNARCESLTSKPVFSRLLPGKRCVVLLDGFYEWHSQGGGGGAASRKQPYHITTANGPQQPVMYMAGLYDVCHDPNGEPLYTFTIVTTDSSEPLTWLHDRMPVILTTPEEISAWLGEEGYADGGSMCLTAGRQPHTAPKTKQSETLVKPESEHPFRSEPAVKTEETQESEPAAVSAATAAAASSPPQAARGEAGDEKRKDGNEGCGGGSGSDASPWTPPLSAGGVGAAGFETPMIKSEGEQPLVDPRDDAALPVTVDDDDQGTGVAGDGGEFGREEEEDEGCAQGKVVEGGGGSSSGSSAARKTHVCGGAGGSHGKGGPQTAEAIRQRCEVLVEKTCKPYGGPLLKWHPVTPEMSKPGYDKPDCCKDVRTKKGSIGSFFKPASKTATLALEAKSAATGQPPGACPPAAAFASVAATTAKEDALPLPLLKPQQGLGPMKQTDSVKAAEAGSGASRAVGQKRQAGDHVDGDLSARKRR